MRKYNETDVPPSETNISLQMQHKNALETTNPRGNGCEMWNNVIHLAKTNLNSFTPITVDQLEGHEQSNAQYHITAPVTSGCTQVTSISSPLYINTGDDLGDAPY